MICSQAKLYREIIKGKDPGEASRPSLIILDDGDNLPVPPPPALEDARSPVDTPSSRRQQQQAVEVISGHWILHSIPQPPLQPRL